MAFNEPYKLVLYAKTLKTKGSTDFMVLYELYVPVIGGE